MLDDHGRYHGDLSALMAACFPVGAVGLTQKRFIAAASELQAGDLLRFYEIGGRKYVYSPTWKKYQQVRALGSKFPEPTADANICKQIPADSLGVVVVVGDGNGDVPPLPPKGGDGFGKFWSAYPRKIGKRKAEDAYRRAEKRAGQSGFLQRVLEAIARQSVSRQWLTAGGRYIPYPASWLNGDRWEDAVETDPRAEDELPRLEV